ncbi:aldo/keto reductase [Bacillus sp. AFS077874]|uniref:aldo/keto reductase n=1 Tax=unclassified Bacillus (in: firmicutes) TaxID=185979 RepID=UPI000BED11D7|nr:MULTISPECIES: aldo/keto reductase [unclassified Bacillus (in: firmicutes)]PEC48397.1 aldo/keto reductase [Bacillus sp. AFS096315]PFM81179.1 aldo/keto reductase [Bacillus sp. AFS077874]
MLTNLKETVTLHNGVKMPRLGLGVFKVSEGEEVVESVKAAIRNGYISIDTAAIYKNEEGVGQAIKESGIAREELFVTSKVWNSEQGYETTLQAFETSLNLLGLDYLDLYLIHWPGVDKYKDTWKALEKLYKDGRVRAIGVSNFQIHHLQDLMSDCDIKPMVNQVEFHPHLTQKELLAFCKNEGIQMEAWSPLKQGQLLAEPVLTKIAQKYNKSVAQVILRWDLQHDVVTIPKSIKENRIIENANIFDFELTQEDMENIDALNQDSRAGSHPDTMRVGF